MKYIILVIVISIFFTFSLHGLLGLFWNNSVDQNLNITTVESLSTILFIPILLSIIHFIIAKKNQIRVSIHFTSLLVILFCVWLSAYFHFENWAKYIGDKNVPDSGTVEVVGFTKGVGYIVGIIAFFISFFQLKKKNKITI